MDRAEHPTSENLGQHTFLNHVCLSRRIRRWAHSLIRERVVERLAHPLRPRMLALRARIKHSPALSIQL